MSLKFVSDDVGGSCIFTIVWNSPRCLHFLVLDLFFSDSSAENIHMQTPFGSVL